MSKSIEEANRDARAAVAAAMAKLPPAPGAKKPAEAQGAMDNLTKKVNEMRTNDTTRGNRHPGTGGYAARGGRGHYRGGRAHSDQKKIEVPATDYDFESANALIIFLARSRIAPNNPETDLVAVSLETRKCRRTWRLLGRDRWIMGIVEAMGEAAGEDVDIVEDAVDMGHVVAVADQEVPEAVSRRTVILEAIQFRLQTTKGDGKYLEGIRCEGFN